VTFAGETRRVSPPASWGRGPAAVVGSGDHAHHAGVARLALLGALWAEDVRDDGIPL